MNPDDEVRTRTLEVVSAYQALLGQGRWDEWIDLWAEDGELDFPFAPGGRKRTYRGKAEIRSYMAATPGRVAIDKVERLRVFPAKEPNVAIVEVGVKGHVPATGAGYDQSYVMFFELKAGKLWRYREYWNPLVSIDAMGGRDAWTQGFGAPAGDDAV